MPRTIQVAHDFICPWCWIGFFQAEQLRRQFHVEIEWVGYELYPDELDWPAPNPPKGEQDSLRPKTPRRLALAYAAQGMDPPIVALPQRMRSHNAHEAVEFAKTVGVADELVARLYRAYWGHGLEINSPAVLRMLATGLVDNLAGMEAKISERRFKEKIIGFDQPAYATGVYNVPTFWINGDRYAEQPYRVLERAMASEGQSVEAPYGQLSFPKAPEDRPAVAINMVATIDGKTVTGEREEPVGDLGSKIDHAAMRNLQAAADAVMIGAGSLRGTPNLWYPERLRRFVVTRSGKIDMGGRFFTDAPEQAYAVLPENGPDLPGVQCLRFGRDNVDLAAALKHMRDELGILALLVEGGSELNGQLLAAGLVDELFLTVAPKVKLGRNIPTYAGGDPLPRHLVQDYRLIEEHQVRDEIFLRYARVRNR